MAFFKLIRLPNLVIVALTQYLLNYRIIQPALSRKGIPPIFDFEHFSLFVLITVLITAGGYIINDISDFRIDMVNRPGKVIIHKKISIQTAFWLYFVVNLIGYILALFVAYYLKQISLANLYPLAAMGLYAYSLKLKKMPFWGNFMVAAYCAAVAGLIWFFERRAYSQLVEMDVSLARAVKFYLLFYLSFAFLSTLFRELVKDLEDMEGDQKTDCRTLPLIWGIPKATRFALLIGGITLLAMLSFALLLKSAYWPFLLLLFGLILLLSYTLFLLYKAHSKGNFTTISRIAKLIMLGGVLLLLLIKI